jgi:hypothetical protein
MLAHGVGKGVEEFLQTPVRVGVDTSRHGRTILIRRQLTCVLSSLQFNLSQANQLFAIVAARLHAEELFRSQPQFQTWSP